MKKTFMQRMKGLAAILTSLVIVGSNTISASAAADYEYHLSFIKDGDNLKVSDISQALRMKMGDKVIHALDLNGKTTSGTMEICLADRKPGEKFILDGATNVGVFNDGPVSEISDEAKLSIWSEGDISNVGVSYDVCLSQSASVNITTLDDANAKYIWYPLNVSFVNGKFTNMSGMTGSGGTYTSLRLVFREVAEIVLDGPFILDDNPGIVEEDGHYYGAANYSGPKCRILCPDDLYEDMTYTSLADGREEMISKYVGGSDKKTGFLREINVEGGQNRITFYSERGGIKLSVKHTERHLSVASPVKHDYKAATCVAEGNKEYYECGLCKKYFEDAPCTREISKEAVILPIDSSNHVDEVTDAAVAATCTKAGKTEGSHCNVCRKVVKAQTEVKALGHKWDNGTVTLAATEEKAGVKTFKCTNAGCSETKTETIPALGHKTHIEDKGTRVEPTCTEKGSVTYKCTVCGEILRTEELEATGHDWNSGKVLKKPTLTKKGSIKYTCKTCKETKTETLAKLKKQAITVDKKVNKTVTLKVKNLKKKKVTLNIKAKAKTTLSYKLTSGNKKYASVSKAGVITLKKGTKAGTYEFTVTAAESLKYTKATKKIVVIVK